MSLNALKVLLLAGALVLPACGGAEPEPAEEIAPDTAVEGAAPADPGMEGDRIPTENGDLIVHPISHATFAMAWNGNTIYVDPVGGAEAFQDLPRPDLVVITDIHGDHLNAETLQAVVEADTQIVAPAAVVEELPEMLRTRARTLANGEEASVLGIDIEAIPMYNLTEARLEYHEKGRGNGYVMEMGGTRVYISGDTEDVPEMRALEDIDVAFVAFNLPFTMTEEQAASAVAEFQPDIVYPYHYRGSDVDAFAQQVQKAAPNVEVRRGQWYEETGATE
jgi:L-ascorbate metabolism protein UlaG (beta-lactamase superfamily)